MDFGYDETHPAYAALDSVWSGVRGRLIVLTGAGVSAASGIPTFRGPEGYWTVGSREYRAQEIATRAFFEEHPDEVWSWYLYRRSVCRAASPNAAHRALARLEDHLRARFLLVTQNVDGLHRRAGSSEARTFEIHGNIDWMRCALDCGAARVPVPASFDTWSRDRTLDDRAGRRLRCACGARMRPHVLWFDEVYDEVRYRFDSSLRAIEDAAMLLVVGTSGATSLPWTMGQIALQRGVPIADVNPDDNPFSAVAERYGLRWRTEATTAVPYIAQRLMRTSKVDEA